MAAKLNGWLQRLDAPPAWFWLLPLLVATLRGLPYFWSLLAVAEPGQDLLPVGYLPRDFPSYMALIRQVPDQGSWIFANPYTTEAQLPRLVLLLHALLGAVAAVLPLRAHQVLELSRFPLTLAFFGVLWWFLQPIFADRRERFWACAIVGLSGGLEGFLKPFMGLLPEFVATRYAESVWHLYGWNTFASLFNPLWIAGLTLTLVVLRPLLQAELLSRRQQLQIGVGLFLLQTVHPYSAIVVVAVAGVLPLLEWIVLERIDWRRQLRIAAAMVPALMAIALLSHWQSQDPVYREAASKVLGKLQLAVFWYPLTLGAVGLAALRATPTWWRRQHPYRLALWGWTAAVVLLHTSPLINGYHFVFHLHLPLAILATPEVLRSIGRVRAAGSERAPAAVFLLLLFASAGLVTAESVGDVERRNQVPQSYGQIVAALRDQPRGNALVPPDLGNILPAYTPHRVWVGHWFLSPKYLERCETYKRLTSDPDGAAELLTLLDDQQIRYLVVPAEHASRLRTLLAPRLLHTRPRGDLCLFVLRI